mmetsp:Transcript_4867/g.8338  ORF Transcript_4867/g.8338 Transcript_4867/m.8338 type:complete len:217 (-) Transcript_4867:963-1613(-)
MLQGLRERLAGLFVRKASVRARKEEDLEALRTEMRAMVDTNVQMQRRVDYLWGRVRKMVKGNLFISVLKRKTLMRVNQEQEGTTAYNQFFMAQKSLDDALNSRWRCLVLIDSKFYRCWEVLIFISNLVLIYKVPRFFSTLSIELMIDLQSGESNLLMSLVIFVQLLDVLLSTVAQHQVSETHRTEFIRESFHHYLHKRLLIDVLGNFYLACLLFLS